MPDQLHPVMPRAAALVSAAIVCLALSATAESTGIRERMKARTGAVPGPRQKLEARPDTGESILARLRERGVMALHQRTEVYPRREDYAGIEIRFEPVPVPAGALPSQPPPDRPAQDDLDTLIQHYARRYGIEASLVYAVIRAESNFDPNAVSPAGARGLMQLMPGTAAEMGVSDVFDPAQNIAGGTQYLARMFALFGGLDLALAGYNAGPGNVKKYGGVPPFQETRDYIARVRRYKQQYDRNPPTAGLAAAGPAPPPAALPPRTDDAYILRLTSGLTQPAEVVVYAAPYYLIAYQGHQARIPERFVSDIVLHTGAEQ